MPPVASGHSYTGGRRVARRVLSIAALAIGALGLAAPSAGAGDHVARLRLTGVIDQVNATYLEEGLRTAAERGAAAVIVQIDSPGGELTSMDRIIKAILASEVPVITYVAPEGAKAASAATFVTLAGDVAAMAPNTNIGAASPVSGTGEDLPQTLRDKVTNDAVAQITALAARTERNQEWAEAAVREAESVNAAQAIDMRPPVVDLVVPTVDELLSAIDSGERVDGHRFSFDGDPIPALAELPVEDVNMNLGQQFLHLLSDPNIAFLLFTIGFYGIVAELFHPNFFSGIAGAIALLLAFIGSNSLPLNVGGLLLVMLGIGLFALETVVTSYGLLTVGGAISLVLGAFALYTGVEPGQENISVAVHPALVVGLVVLSLAYFGIVVRSLLEMRRGTVPAVPVNALVGTGGKAETTLAPTGVAHAGGESWSARSRSGVIPAGTPVRVVAIEGLQLIVEPAEQPSAVTLTEGTTHG